MAIAYYFRDKEQVRKNNDDKKSNEYATVWNKYNENIEIHRWKKEKNPTNLIISAENMRRKSSFQKNATGFNYCFNTRHFIGIWIRFARHPSAVFGYSFTS